MKKFLLLIVLALILTTVGYAQFSPSGQIKMITPNTLSACARDTIWVELTNKGGPTCTTTSGPPETVQLAVTIPGSGQINYQANSVGSSSNIASEVSYSGNVLTMTMNVPSFGSTNRAWFVLNALCNIRDLSDLPSLSITANYPSSFPIATETWQSAKMNVGIGEITFTHTSASYINTNARFSENLNHSQYITNTGFGRITELRYHQIVHDSLIGYIGGVGNDWAYIARVSPSAQAATSWNMNQYPDYQITNLGNGYRYISFTIKGAQLDRADGQFDPGDRLQLNATYYKAPSSCIAPMKQYQWVTYNCIGSAEACAVPDSLEKTIRISAGVPIIGSTNSNFQTWDGCPNKTASFTFKNTGTPSATNPEVSTAYDVSLGLSFNGKLTISNLTLGNVTTVTTTPAIPSTVKSFTWNVKDQLTFDPDGAGKGLEDLDADGYYDDMRPGDSINVSFLYTVDCDLACGADLNYIIKGNSSYTDYCRILNNSQSVQIARFGFQQTAAISQITPTPNYGTMSNTEKKTVNGSFTFNYRHFSLDTSNAIVKLRINYSKTMQVTGSVYFLNTSIPLSSFTVIGAGSLDTTNGSYNNVTDKDSALEYTLTKAQINLLLDNVKDSLSYNLTHISCDSFQNQNNKDTWQLLFQINNAPCSATNNPPCAVDLACGKSFAYQVTEGCGTKPCYVVVDSIYRASPHGFTDENQTTGVIPTAAGTSRFYAGDTVTYLRTAILSADYPYMEAIGQTSGGNDFNSYFSFNYNKDPNISIYDLDEPAYKFIPTISRVKVYDTTTNTLLYDLPLEYKYFNSWEGFNQTSNRGNLIQADYITNSTTYTGPSINSVPGIGLGDHWCNNNTWVLDGAACPYGDRRYYTPGSIVQAVMVNDANTRVSERYTIHFERALTDAAISFEPGYTKYKWVLETKWLVNPAYPHNNVADMLVRGAVGRTGNGVNPIPGTNMGTCGGIKNSISNVSSKEVVVENGGATYQAACNLTICNQVRFKSQTGDYFPSEVRVPYKLDSIVVDMPTEYRLTTAPTFSGTAGGPSNSIVASDTTGHIVFTNNTANSGTSYPDFPRISDVDGNSTSWQVCYPISNVGTDNFITQSYKVPVKYYARDEFNNIIVLIDTFNITESTPAITLTPLGGSIQVNDGGACQSSYMDVLVSNNTIYSADKLFIAAESNSNVTVLNITDAPDETPLTPITAADTSWYGTNNLFVQLGGMSAGGRRVVRVYFSTLTCQDSLKIFSNFGCNYPITQQPEYPSPNLDSAYISFKAVDPGMLSGPINGNKSITDLCSVQTLEVEVRNVKNPNLTSIIAGIKLPPNATYVANSAEIAYPSATYTAAPSVTASGTDSLTINISADLDLANACGLPGADETTWPGGINASSAPNVVKFRFNIDFSACPTTSSDEVTYLVTAQNYCGTPVTTKGIFNLIYVGTTSTANVFSCTAINGEPIAICADSGTTNSITDNIWVKNTSGPTTAGSNNFIEITMANDTTAFTMSNFSVAAPWTAPTVTYSIAGRPILKFAIPAGLAVNDSLQMSLSYNLTPKVHDVCNQLTQSCADIAYSVSFYSEVTVSCPAKSLNCTALSQVSRGTGYIPKDLTCCPQGLGNYVWLDTDKDGIQDANEVGVSGVQVDLYNNGTDGLPNTEDDVLVGSTTTDAYGYYYFNNLPIGSYNLGFTPPANYTFTNPVGSGDNSNGTNSDVNNTASSPNFGRTGTFVLTTTEQDSTIDVGLILTTPTPPQTASVGNYVWFDADGDGFQDPTESGIAGVLVNLLDASGNIVATTITDASGQYLFSNVPPGTYSVQFGEPIGMVASQNNGGVSNTTNSDINPSTLTSAPFVVNAGDSITYVDAGFVLQNPNNASLGNRVWYDSDNDGIQDAGEAGVPGIKVYLYAADGVTKLDSTVTNALGNYLFNNLTPGYYVVGFDPTSLPSGFVFTTQNAGSSDAENSDANTTTGKTGIINLQAGQHNMTIDAGIDNPALTNSIGDYVWNDINKDGIQNPGEPAFPGVTVTLYDVNGMPIATTVTDANGFYSFPELPNGTYQVGFSNLPPGYGFTSNNSGGDSVDSDADPVTGLTNQVVLTGNTNITNLDAGVYQTGSSSSTASLGDKIWVDLNGDNLQDANEPGIAGVTVYLYAGDGVTVLDSTVTDAQGNYIFTNLPAGAYVVGVDLSSVPAGYLPVTQDAGGASSNANNGTDTKDSDGSPLTGKTGVINLNTGDDNLGIDFGFTPPTGTASLGNYVWYDTDQDGIQDANEIGVSGVQVNLLDASGNIVATTTTNSDGYYAFTGLTPGTYSVQFSQIPSGYNFTNANVGTNDGIDSDADPITGTSSTVTLTAGQNNTTLDAGIFSNTKAGLGDYVWFDTNGDGIQDANEAPIPGVLVTLYDASGTTPIATAVTDANGHYFFPNLDPGTYVVGFSNLPLGTEFTTQESSNSPTGSNVNPSTGKTNPIVLGAGEINTSVDAGVKTTELSGLGNYVWNDLDEDGIQDPNEPGLPGIIVTLYAADGVTVIGTTVTNGDGAYSFNNLPAGDYVVGFSNLPTGATSTVSNGSLNDSLNSDMGTNGKTGIISLLPGTYNPNIDAGIVLPTQGLGNVVWLDLDNDGVQDPNEVGVAGVQVDLYSNGPDGLPNTEDDVLVGSTTTDAYGKYFFDNIPTGSYNLGFTPPANYTFTTPVSAGDNSVNTNSDVNNTAGSPNFGRTGTYVISIGERDSTIDAGLVFPTPVQTASVGNYVWFDADGDGFQDPTENGLAGVLVSLLDASGNVVATTITDANGHYLFSDVTPGTYSVKFSEPIGMIPTQNNGAVSNSTNSDINPNTLTSAPFVVNAGDSIRYVDAGFNLQNPNNASIGDKVWFDANNDGIQDPDEAGAPGIKVYLYAADGVTKLDSTVTDPLGNYVFNNLTPGDYVIGFDPNSLPSGFSFSPQNAGTDSTKNSDANPGTGKTGVITLLPGQKNTSIDAGIDNPSLTNSIGDYVWYDADKDGIQDANETGVAGITVTLYDNNGLPIATTVTNASGFYLFPELANGTYSVGFSNLPNGYGFTKKDATANNLDSDVDPTTGLTSVVVLTGNTNIRELDAGIYQTGNSSGTASLGDKVWVDLDGDNLQDANEPGLEGIKVYLYASDGTTKLDSTVTDGQGNYIFTNLPAGDYIIGFDLSTLPAGYSVVAPDAGGAGLNTNDLSDANDSDANPFDGKTSVIRLNTGDDNLGVDLGVSPPAGTASLGNYVWYDTNQDGIQDANEIGVQGVQVNLLDNLGRVVATTTTNSQGYYSFTGLTPGNYSVQFSQIPNGYNFTNSNVGSNDGLDSDADPITGATAQVTLTAGQNNTTLDAGIFSTTKAGLGDYVWFDTNGDGIQDPNESPIPGVLVTLYDATGTTPIATAVTDANGYYFFPNLDPGTYVVGFTNLPLGTEFTTQESGNSPNGSDVNPGTGKTGPIVLVAGEINTGVDAGVKTNEPAGLGNYVWHDVNENGIQDLGEPGVAGVLVTLYAADGVTVIGRTITDGDGKYSFTNLPAGDYIVGFSNLPIGSTPTLQSGGVDNPSNSDIGIGGKTSVISLTPGSYNSFVDGGIYFGVPLGAIGLVAETAIFEGRNDCRVNWYTLTESNTSEFEIERSTDGVNFFKVGTKEAGGNTIDKTNYEFLDDVTSLIKVNKIYYRIKLVDIDKSFIYSNVINVQRPNLEEVSVYPTLFNSEVFIGYKVDEKTIIDVNISDISGRRIKQYSFTLTEGMNRVSVDGLDGLATGNYYINIYNKTTKGSHVTKLQKK